MKAVRKKKTSRRKKLVHYHHSLQIRLGASEVALLSYFKKKLGNTWAEIIRDGIHLMAENAPYFEAHDFKKFVNHDLLATLEDPLLKDEFKIKTNNLLNRLKSNNGFSKNLKIELE